MINSKTMDIKIIDFGSSLEDKFCKRPNLYIQSRYYRAPEVLYGINYGKEIDTYGVMLVFYMNYFLRNHYFREKIIRI